MSASPQSGGDVSYRESGHSIAALIDIREGKPAVVAHAGRMILVIRPPDASPEFLCWLAAPILADSELARLRSTLDAEADV